MDKSEYRAKLDQITEFVNAGDYQGAQTIVDEVDWRRVKSARTLCMVSEIYEMNDRLPDSRKVLELAYKRALVKTVAYRLVEVCLKLNDTDAAQDYYDDFVDLAPMDNSKYILKYKIHNAKKDPLEMQIKALEDYKEREYTEHWAYELAKLYSQNDDKDACVEACDDLILWFSEGPYVFKAMELKKKYAPLSPSQHEKYKKELAAKSVQAAVPSFIKVPAEQKEDTAKEVKSAEVKKAEVKKAEVKEEIEAPEEESISAEAVIEKMDAAASTTVQADKGFRLPIGKGAVGAVKSSLDPGRMQSQLADSIRNVFAGINKGSVQLDTQTESKEEKFEDLYQPEEDMVGYEIKDLEPETTQEEKELAAEAVVSTPVTVEEEDDQIEGQMSFEDFTKKETEFDFEALFAETTNALAKELASGNFGAEESAVEEPVIEESTVEELTVEETAMDESAEELPAADITVESECVEETEKEATVVDEIIEDEFSEENNPHLYGKETDESLGLTREFDLKEQIKRKIVIDTTEGEVVLPEDFEVTFQEEETSFEKEAVQTDDVAEAVQITEEAAEELPIVELAEEDDDIKLVEEPVQEELITDPDLIVLPEEEERVLEYLPVEPRPLTEEEKEIFTYFSRIPGLGEQITVALSDIHNNAGDKTSKSGNFLVIGRQGSGKTRLYESMVLAVCKDLGMEAAKNAKILARDFNQKDPAAVVAKLSGGFLAIEGAGELSDEAAEKLAQAMEFRTDSLVVALEDEKDDLMNMLERNPRLAEKFTSTIKIPVFTNDELVAFARIYAQDQGYRMDEMGVLALYTKIGDNQKDSEPVTVARVKEMMDAAMVHSNKGHRKLSRRFTKNAVDEENRILLLEKDFE